MVVEYFAENIKKRPLLMFFLVGAIYFSLGLLIGRWKFGEYYSLFMIFFTVIAAMPAFIMQIKKEESHAHDFKAHSKVISMFLLFFFGIVFASTLWSLAFDLTYPAQLEAIGEINPSLVTGNATASGEFWSIFQNNMEVMVLCIVFSFLFGSGSLVILTWNATVLGLALSLLISSMAHMGYGTAILAGLARFFIHAIPEIAGFVTAGLAGGIISVAVIKHHLFTKKSHSIILDSSQLIIVSIILILVAALFEVYLTPYVFSLF